MKPEPVIIVQLLHIEGSGKGRIQEFSKPVITIGRDPACDLQLPGKTSAVSRNHAQIVREKNRFRIIDRSTQGTFVNGRKVREAFLKNGDVITFSPDGPEVSFLSRSIEARDIEQNLDVIRPEPMMQVDVPKPAAGETVTRKTRRQPATKKPGRRRT